MRYLTDVEQTGRHHRTYRDAETPEDAARSAVKSAWLGDYRMEESRSGRDSYGAYAGYVVRFGRSVCVVRVYTEEATLQTETTWDRPMADHEAEYAARTRKP